MTKAEILYEDWQKRKISDFKLISELVLLYNEAEKKQIEYQKIAQKTKEYLEFVISGRQNKPETNDKMELKIFYISKARADLAVQILDLIEHRYEELDSVIRCGDKIFDIEVKTFK